MAKDPPNQLGRGRLVNQLIEDDVSAFERIGRRSGMRSAEDRADRQRLHTARETLAGLEEFVETNPLAAKSKDIMKGISDYRADIKRLGPRVRLRRDARADRAVNMAVNTLERQFSSRSINGMVDRLSGSEDVQGASLNMMGMSSKELEASRASIMGHISGLEQQAIGLAENNLFDREGRPNQNVQQQINALQRQKGLRVSELAVVAAAERKKRVLGQDTESQMDDLFKQGQRADALLRMRGAEEDRAKGQGLGAMSLGELKKQEAAQAKELTERLKELTDGTAKTAEQMEKLQKEAQGVSGDLKKTQEAIKAAEGGGGGFGGKYAGLINNLPGILSPIGQAFQAIAINQPLQVRQNQIGFASAANQIFDSRRSALAGNMTELSLLSSGTFARAQGEGDSFRARSIAASTINTSVGVATAAAGTVQAVNGAKNVGTTFGYLGSNEVMAGTATAVQGAAQAATNISDIAQGATAQATALQAQGLALSQDRENIYVTGAMRQQFYNYSMGVRGAALAGGGGVGDRILRAFEDPNGLSRLESARIGTEQFAALSADAAGAQGSVFDPNQVFAARGLERSGFGTMQANMAHMSRLAGAGSNNPQAGLQSVLEAAFSKSLDSSKAISMMVENTAMMAQSSLGGQLGILDTTKSSSAILANLVNEENPNKEMALQRAVSAADIFNQANSGIGRNFADMAGIAAISKGTGISDVSAVNVKSLSDADARALQAKLIAAKGDPALERKLAAELRGDMGMGEFESGGKVNFGGIEKALKIRNQSILRSPEFLAIIGKNTKGFDKLVNGEMTMEDLNSPEYEELADNLGKAARRKGLTSREVVAGLRGELDTSAGVNQAKGAIDGKVSGTKADLDDLATAQFQNMTKEARLAAQALGGVNVALKQIKEATESLNGKLNDKTADDFRSAAANAAKEFHTAATVFTAGVTGFGQAVDRLRERQGLPKLPPLPPVDKRVKPSGSGTTEG